MKQGYGNSHRLLKPSLGSLLRDGTCVPATGIPNASERERGVAMHYHYYEERITFFYITLTGCSAAHPHQLLSLPPPSCPRSGRGAVADEVVVVLHERLAQGLRGGAALAGERLALHDAPRRRVEVLHLRGIQK